MFVLEIFRSLVKCARLVFLYFIHLLYFLNLMSLQNKKAGRGRVPAGQIIAYCFRHPPLRRWRPGDL